MIRITSCKATARFSNSKCNHGDNYRNGDAGGTKDGHIRHALQSSRKTQKQENKHSNEPPPDGANSTNNGFECNDECQNVACHKKEHEQKLANVAESSPKLSPSRPEGTEENLDGVSNACYSRIAVPKLAIHVARISRKYTKTENEDDSRNDTDHGEGCWE